MNGSSYVQGFLVTTALLAMEHLALYARLKELGDTGVLIKFALGVLAILAGCAVIAWRDSDANAVLAPLVCSAGGLVIVAGHIGRWLFDRARETSYMRGRLAGLADKADIAEGTHDGTPGK